MITLDELKRLSGRFGFDVTVLEKDYCLGWFLKFKTKVCLLMGDPTLLMP
jgi:hypothetical protein